MNDTIYLDYAAATPVAPDVLSAMLPFFTDQFYNPSATYLAALSVRRDLSEARATAALTLGCRPSEVVFTAGATEANNLVLRGVMEAYPDSNVIVSAVEHDSVLMPARLYPCQEASVLSDGTLDLAACEKLIDDKTVLISVMYANNEVGTIQPIRQLAQILEKVRRERQKAGNRCPLYLHTDAAQAANYLDLHVARLGVDFLTLNGGKLYGPKQSGLLFAASHTRLKPQVLGGGQERGLRSGTENVAGSIGLAIALQLTQSMRAEETERLKALQKLFFALLTEKLPDAVVNGSLKTRLPNNVHVTLPGRDNERLLIALDEAGIMAAAGSACSASDDEPSHVLKAMGLSDEQAQSSLRFSMGRATTEADIRRTVDELSRIA